MTGPNGGILYRWGGNADYEWKGLCEVVDGIYYYYHSNWPEPTASGPFTLTESLPSLTARRAWVALNPEQEIEATL